MGHAGHTINERDMRDSMYVEQFERERERERERLYRAVSVDMKSRTKKINNAKEKLGDIKSDPERKREK